MQTNGSTQWQKSKQRIVSNKKVLQEREQLDNVTKSLKEQIRLRRDKALSECSVEFVVY